MFQRCRFLQEVRFTLTLCCDAVGHFWSAFGDGSGLVQNHSVDFMGNFQTFRRFDEDTILCAFACADHDSGRGRKTQRAWAGNYQNGNTTGEGVMEFITQQQPHDDGDRRNTHNSRHEDTADFVSQLGDWRFGAAGFFHQTDDLSQCSILTDFLRFHFEETGFVQGSTHHNITAALFNRNTLAGESRFVHSTVAFHDDTINRNALAGTNHNNITDQHLLHRNFLFHSTAKNYGGFRRQIHQLTDCIGSTAFRAAL